MAQEGRGADTIAAGAATIFSIFRAACDSALAISILCARTMGAKRLFLAMIWAAARSAAASPRLATKMMISRGDDAPPWRHAQAQSTYCRFHADSRRAPGIARYCVRALRCRYMTIMPATLRYFCPRHDTPFSRRRAAIDARPSGFAFLLKNG